MLNNEHFYYRSIRKNVISFGTLFKNIQLIKYAKDSDTEIERIVVPLSYLSKENFVKRLYGNPDLHKPTQITLPRMTFEMTGIAYDHERKLTSITKSYSKVTNQNTLGNQMYVGVPYDFNFELNIYARNVEDGTQIVEQILPYFNPDYTLTISYIDGNNSAVKDVPIILESITHTRDEDGPAETTVRTIVWTLTFKMKSYFFGPNHNSKIIKTANTNIYSNMKNTIQLTLGDGSLDYLTGEPVYQGGINWSESTNRGYVANWDSLNNLALVFVEKGFFTANSSNIIGIMTNTSRNINSIESYSGHKTTIQITPSPISANIGDDFGYTETIYEFPDF